jgi:hypothetical protein
MVIEVCRWLMWLVVSWVDVGDGAAGGRRLSREKWDLSEV